MACCKASLKEVGRLTQLKGRNRDKADTPDGARTLTPVAAIAGTIVRTFEALNLRGAPTLLRLLSKVPALAKARATVRLGNHTIAFPAYDAYWSRHIWAGAAYELDVEQIFRKIGPGRALIDCGANIGYWSIRAADFGFTHVVAIEANRDLMPFLLENFRLNGTRGEAIHAAVYSASGQQLFLDNTDAHAQGGIGSKGMPVTSVAIADVMKKLPAGCEAVVKLDVEGAEIAAIEGITSFDDIILVYEDFARQGMRVTEYLLGRGIEIFGVGPDGQTCRIVTVDEAIAFNASTAASPGGPSNLVACSAGRSESLEAQLRS